MVAAGVAFARLSPRNRHKIPIRSRLSFGSGNRIFPKNQLVILEERLRAFSEGGGVLMRADCSVREHSLNDDSDGRKASGFGIISS